MEYPEPAAPGPTGDDTNGDQSRNRSRDLMLVNLAIAIIATICLAVIGNRMGLEIVTGNGGFRSGNDLETTVAIAMFTTFFAVTSSLICIARKQALSWTFTALTMVGMFATVIATVSVFP